MNLERNNFQPETGNTPKSYLKSLKEAGERSGGIARLDRSEFFRHKRDFEIFAERIKDAQEKGEQLKFLEIGIGNMEEPISFLATADSELGDKDLKDVVDMEIVEIRDKEEVSKNCRLGKQLFNKKEPIKPRAYRDSFVLVDGEYQPKEEIIEYLSQTINDENKAHFGTSIENFTKNTKERYPIVSCNNVIQHLGGIEEYSSPYKNSSELEHSRYYEEIRRILDLVEIGGIIFIHAPALGDRFDTKSKGADTILTKILNFELEFEKIASGVYRRKAKD